MSGPLGSQVHYLKLRFKKKGRKEDKYDGGRREGGGSI